MTVEFFEVAVSRYTFAGDQLQEQQVQVAMKAVTPEELAGMIASYQLKFVHSALHLGKAVALGSGNVLSETMTLQGGTRICYGMVVFSLDGVAPTAKDTSAIAKTFNLELRENFSPSPSAAAANLAPTRNLGSSRAYSPQISQGAL
jgi:hypothetical protein